MKSFRRVVLAMLAVWVQLSPDVCRGLDQAVGAAGIDAAALHGIVTGAGVKVGVLDDKVATHPNLNVAGNGGTGVAQEHATEVAGVINSSHATYTGVAPGSSIYGYTVSTWSSTFDGAEWLADQGVRIIAYPFGWPLGDGEELDGDTWESRHVDFMASQKDVLLVVSGNQGGGGIPLPSDAFNAITVNATVMTASGKYDQLAGWNYYGEVPNNGRSKPDLVAPGGYESLPERHPESIYTTTLGDGFANVSGTSFAAPMVAGAAALLTEYGNQHGLSTNHNVLKAVLLNSADKTVRDMFGRDWLQSEAYTSFSIPLDDQLGAGQLDALAAFRQYSAGQHAAGTVPMIGWNQASITGAGTFVQYHFAEELLGGSFLRATLVWDRRVTLEDDQDGDGRFDYFGSDWLHPRELNDLDINLYSPQGNLVGGSWSGVDNVEHFYWEVPQDGHYYLGVEFFDVFDLASQSYALAWETVPSTLRAESDGAWGDPDTWNHGDLVPESPFKTVISGHSVSVGSNTTARSLVLESGSTLTIESGQSLILSESLVADDAVIALDENSLLEAATVDILGILEGSGTVKAGLVTIGGTLSPGNWSPSTVAIATEAARDGVGATADVPEPATWLSALVFFGLLGARRRSLLRRTGA